MGENSESRPTAGASLTADQQTRRRARLQQLLGKATYAPQPLPLPNAKGPAAAGPGRMGGKLEQLIRNQAIHRAHRILLDTPAEDDGMVPETNFTLAGLRKLLAVLRTRADSDGLAGAKAAQNLLNFMAPGSADEPQVEGISVAKLQRLANIGKPESTN